MSTPQIFGGPTRRLYRSNQSNPDSLLRLQVMPLKLRTSTRLYGSWAHIVFPYYGKLLSLASFLLCAKLKAHLRSRFAGQMDGLGI